jgi:hypothetical protein
MRRVSCFISCRDYEKILISYEGKWKSAMEMPNISLKDTEKNLEQEQKVLYSLASGGRCFGGYLRKEILQTSYYRTYGCWDSLFHEHTGTSHTEKITKLCCEGSVRNCEQSG